MTQRIVVELLCDACEDEQPAQRTMTFGFDSNEGTRREYQVELCATHLVAFMQTLGPWTDVARHAPAAQPKRPSRSRAAASKAAAGAVPAPARHAPGRQAARRDPEQLEGIRIWARAHGLDVGERGPIPAEIEAAYNRRDNLSLVGTAE